MTRKASAGPLTFVVQKHAARRLHYDFRLEVDGVLKSWPIPNGPSYTHGERRLAVMTEDHPLDYATFEGVIPKGEYGGGQVIVWDAGIYAPEDDDGQPVLRSRARPRRWCARASRQGKLTVFVYGRKLRGAWTLVHTQDKNWLFLKKDDSFADANHDVLAEDASILSGLTIDDLKAGRLPDRPRRSSRCCSSRSTCPGARRGPLPKMLSPMLPSLAEKAVFESATGCSSPSWTAIGSSPRSRTARSAWRRAADSIARPNTRGWSKRCASSRTAMPIFDGEIVALDEHGRAVVPVAAEPGQRAAPVPGVLRVRSAVSRRLRPARRAARTAQSAAGQQPGADARRAGAHGRRVPRARHRAVRGGARRTAWRASSPSGATVATRRASAPTRGSRSRRPTATSSSSAATRAGSGAREKHVRLAGGGLLQARRHEADVRRPRRLGLRRSDAADAARAHASACGRDESPFDDEVPRFGMWRRPGKAEGPITWVRAGPGGAGEVRRADVGRDPARAGLHGPARRQGGARRGETSRSWRRPRRRRNRTLLQEAKLAELVAATRARTPAKSSRWRSTATRSPSATSTKSSGRRTASSAR